MNLSALNTESIPKFDEIIKRNSINILFEAPDIGLIDGNIAVSPRGNIVMNDTVYTALWELVDFWRNNFQALHGLFLRVFDVEEEEAIQSKIQAVGPLSLALSEGYTPDTYADIHTPLYALRETRKIYAGVIVLVIVQALSVFQKDIGANESEWNSAAPKLNGHSFGALLRASGNNMRHHDEWRVAKKPSNQALKSINVIKSALEMNIKNHDSIQEFGKNMCPQLLDILSKRDFLTLEHNIFSFAQNLSEQRDHRIQNAS